jgi:Glycosyl transferase family 2
LAVSLALSDRNHPLDMIRRSERRAPAVCLSMIVKNEAAVVERCLDSVRPLVDYVVVADTGSTDGTQDIIRRYLVKNGISGVLVDRPWRDFATNRNEALELARRHGDYLLFIDADDTLEFDPGFTRPDLTHDYYNIEIHFGSTVYDRNVLVRSALPWRWRGVLHEFLDCEGQQTSDRLSGVRMRISQDGARRKSASTYARDAAVLQAALDAETDPFMRSRYTFYLAQSHRDCGEREKALHYFLARAELGYWQDEVFYALYRAAQMKEELGLPDQDVIDAYLRAAAAQPARAEALHGAAKFCRAKGRNAEDYAQRGIAIAQPSGGLFVDSWVYDYGLLDEVAVNGYWSGHYWEAAGACAKMLASPKTPLGMRERVLANLRFSLDKLPKSPNLGKAGERDLLAQHKLAQARELHSRTGGRATATPPRVLVAILAKQKEPSLPLYLDCIEALDYPKSSIVLYIRTNNNTDRTEPILREWVARVGHLYGGVEFDSDDVADPVEQFGVHEWNPTRFRVLGRIRNISLRRALEHKCDFYFVADVDNFVRPCTLRELVALDLPIVSPFLRSISPGAFYSNYHAEIDESGYYWNCDQYHWILNRWVQGLIEVPVVHCTYLVRTDALKGLTYEDGTTRYEYVIFSDSARNAAIPQYLDNRQVYGYITFDVGNDMHVDGGIEQARALLSADLRASVASEESLGPIRSETPTKALKTLIFCTSFATTTDEWNQRYRRWLEAIRASDLVYDSILMVDDGSPVLPDWPDAEFLSDGTALSAEVGVPRLCVYHFGNHLGRKAVFDFPGWHRSFAFAGRYAQECGFEKVIHIESDAFVIGSRLQRYLNNATGGWTALWCPLFDIPETAIQVIAGDAVRRFAHIAQTHPHERLVGRAFEIQLPVDHVEKGFIGNRYGECLPVVPGNAEYAVQVRSAQSPDYYWWLKPS